MLGIRMHRGRAHTEKRGNRPIWRESPGGVRHLCPVIFAWIRLAACLALALAGVVATAAPDELRFSVAIEAAERTACGLPRLTSDQVAVLDAFVRRDTANRGSARAPDTTNESKPNATFSQRLTANERQTAGLATLTPVELAQLDATVERHQNARLARTLLAPLSYVTSGNRIVPTERKKEREIHGSFTLSYAVGSGGYSEKSGSMVLSLADPDKGYAISVGYTETHTKGGVPYYLYRDPLYDRTRNPLDDPLRP